MTRRAYARYGGLLVALGLLLPRPASATLEQGPVVPAEPAVTEPAGPEAPGTEPDGPVAETAGPDAQAPESVEPPAAPVDGEAPDSPSPAPAPPAPPTGPLIEAWSSIIGERPSVELVVTRTHAITIGIDLPMTARTLDAGELAWTSPVLADTVSATAETVYAAGRAQILAVRAETGELLWSVPTTSRVRTLAATGDLIVAVADREVTALRQADGGRLWQVPLDRLATGGAAGHHLAVVPLDDRSVLALDLATGEPRWRTTFDTLPLAITVGPDRVFVGLPHIAVCGLLNANGRIDWCTTQLRAPVVGAPLVREDTLVVAQRDGGLRTLDRRTGTMLAHVLLRGRPATAPLVVDGDVVVPLASETIAVLGGAGRLARIPSPRSPDRTGVSPDGSTLVTLSVLLSGERIITAYVPPPPAPPPAPAVPAAAAPGAPPDEPPPDEP